MIDKFRGRYRFLSNFYNNRVDYKGVVYTTAEHAFQANKSNSRVDLRRVQSCPTPGKAKALGRIISLRPDWEEVKDEIMLGVIRSKFNDAILYNQLLDTGTQVLTEGNTWHDNYWGNCTCFKCSAILGENHLGLILMKVREEKHVG